MNTLTTSIARQIRRFDTIMFRDQLHEVAAYSYDKSTDIVMVTLSHMGSGSLIDFQFHGDEIVRFWNK